MISLDTKIDVTYDVIEVEGNLAPALQWCSNTFGNPGERWFVSNNRFYFLQSKDAMLFELRWYA
jgi:hypothetical protein